MLSNSRKWRFLHRQIFLMELVGQVKVREEAFGDLRVPFFERKHHGQLQTRWEDLI